MDMKKQLTTAEVAQVDAWIRQRGFTFEDVRLEILDHVLCAMEERMANDPNLSTAQAYKQVHASFGVFGFSTLEDAYIKSTEKRIYQSFFRQLLGLVQPRGLFISLSAVLFSFTTHVLLGNEYVVWIPLLVAVFFMWQRIRIYYTHKELRKLLAFRMALAPIFFSFTLSMYIPFWHAEIDLLQNNLLWPLCTTFLSLIEWAQWQVLQAELDKNSQLQLKLFS